MPSKYPRSGKWIVPTGRTWAPASVISVVCQTADLGRDSLTGRTAESLHRVHVVESHRRKRVWTGTLYRSFEDGESFHDWLELYASHRRRTYIFTPSVMDALTLTDWWLRIERRGCILVRNDKPAESAGTDSAGESEASKSTAKPNLRRSEIDPDTYMIQAVPSGVEVELCRYSTRGRSYQWTRNSQYLSATEEQIAEAIAFTWPNSHGTIDGLSTTFRHPIDRAFLWCNWYRKMADWWISVNGGPWGPTTASLAYNYLRRRLLPRTILHHGDERCGELERAATFGGRRSVWYIGNIGSEQAWEPFAEVAPARSDRGTLSTSMIHWDVRSMYPFLLSRMAYPVERIGFERKISIAHCLGALQTHGVIARVTIRSFTPEYPFRRDGRTAFPIGSFVTTLAGPELMHALATGDATRVHNAAIYRLGRPFAAAADPLLRLRGEYREQGEKGWELLAKQFANSMTGKMAPRPTAWVPRPQEATSVHWGPWRRRDVDTGEVRHFRSLAGMTWERIQTTESIRPMGAAYVYLTSYGRALMHGYRRLLPAKCVLAQDTDGIWCTRESLFHLTFPHDERQDQSGELAQSPLRPAGRFFGPQHYWYGDGWVLSGMSRPLIDPGSQIAHVEQSQPVVYTSTVCPNPILYKSHSQVGLHERIALENVGDDGWVNPPKEFVADD